MHIDARPQGFLALAPDGLALARGEPIQEIVEIRITIVFPMELLVSALQKTSPAKQAPFALGQKCHVGRRQLICGCYFSDGTSESSTDRILQRAGRGKQARSGYRCERHCDLKLGIVIAARALEGFGPTMIENILAAGMGLHIAGHRSQEGARRVFGEDMTRLPTGSASDRSRVLKRGQKLVCDERIVGLSLRG